MALAHRRTTWSGSTASQAGGRGPPVAAVRGSSRAIPHGTRVSLSELLGELDGEAVARVLYAIAVVKRRQNTTQASPDDLWIRAAEPE